jgi:hypothetical protein
MNSNLIRRLVREELTSITGTDYSSPDHDRFKVGDLVKDINPDCPHHGAEGVVTKVTKDSVMFVVNNTGRGAGKEAAVYQPGDELEKTKDQMRKLTQEGFSNGSKRFEKERLENAEVLGYELTGVTDGGEAAVTEAKQLYIVKGMEDFTGKEQEISTKLDKAKANALIKIIKKQQKQSGMDIYTNMRLVPVEEAVNEGLSKQQLKGMIMRAKRAGAKGYDIILSLSRDLSTSPDKIVKTLEMLRLIGLTESNELRFPGKIGEHAEFLKVNEVAPKGWEGTVKAMKDEKGIDNPWALAWWMKNKGYKSHKEVREGAIFAVKGKSGPGGHKKANKPPFKYDPIKEEVKKINEGSNFGVVFPKSSINSKMSSSDRDRNLSKAKDNIKNLVKKLRPQIKKEYGLGLRATVKSEDYYGSLKNDYPNHQKVLYSTFRLINLEDKNAAIPKEKAKKAVDNIGKIVSKSLPKMANTTGWAQEYRVGDAYWSNQF